MFQSLCEEGIDELTGHFFVVVGLDLFGFRPLQSRNLIGYGTMIKKHVHTICRTHEGDLIALSYGRVDRDIVALFLNTVGNRFKRHLHLLSFLRSSRARNFIVHTYEYKI